MKSIINFYQELDTLNLILFWGIIIVIILLLIFSIILANKNKKLNAMLISSRRKLENDSQEEQIDDIPVIKTEEVTIKNTREKEYENVIVDDYVETPKVDDLSREEIKKEISTPIVIPQVIEDNQPEEKKFVAEEHVMEYKPELFNLPNLEKTEPEKEIIKEEPKKEETPLPNAPYQRNVLREKYSNQTSPIGIVRREDSYQTNARELHNALNEEENTPPKRYLEEVSQKLNRASDLNDIDRTAYEIQQEEDAIISYQELMDKKDRIKIVDEEDAVISIDELMHRKKEEEKLYNITKEEENNTFIDELKHFRHDL